MGGICSSESVVTPASGEETSKKKEPLEKHVSEHLRKENINRRRLASRIAPRAMMRGLTSRHVALRRLDLQGGILRVRPDRTHRVGRRQGQGYRSAAPGARLPRGGHGGRRRD